MTVDECRSCHAPIIWAVSATTGRRMPIDAEPVDDGNIWLGGHDPVRAHVTASDDQPSLIADAERYRSHFSTCPQADRWRRDA